MAIGRRSFLCTFSEWLEKPSLKRSNSSQTYEKQNQFKKDNFTSYLTKKLSLAEQKKGKEIGTKELGEKYFFLVLDKTKQFFDDHQLIKNLGIDKTNE